MGFPYRQSLGLSSLEAEQPKPGKGQQTVDDQKLKSEFVAGKPLFSVQVHHVANHRRGYRHKRDQSISYGTPREQAKGVQAKQWAIGVAGRSEQLVDHGIIIHSPEDQDHDHQYACHPCMNPLTSGY